MTLESTPFDPKGLFHTLAYISRTLITVYTFIFLASIFELLYMTLFYFRIPAALGLVLTMAHVRPDSPVKDISVNVFQDSVQELIVLQVCVANLS